MWNLDDSTCYIRVLDLQLDGATTYADMREGKKDKEKREKIRQSAAAHLNKPQGVQKWAFRITVSKNGKRRFDIENVSKTIIDAFCEWQIERDGSPYSSVGLYPDDSLDHVVVLEVGGKRSLGQESTRIEIFAVAEPGKEEENQSLSSTKSL